MDKKITIIITIISASLVVIQIAAAEPQLLQEATCTTCHETPKSHISFSEKIACETCHGRLSTKLNQLALNHKRIIANGTALGLSCLTCHEQNLGAHSNLGVGGQVCLACHDGFVMQPHALDGTLLTDATISNLCANCHRERYADWKIGVHGTHGLNYTSTELAPGCTTCHNPHTPDLPTIQTLPAPEEPERHQALTSTLLPPVMALIAGMVAVTITVSRRNGGNS